MKKFLIAAAIVATGFASMSAQLLKQPKFFDNMRLGLDGGATTELNQGAFWGDMRGVVGIHLDKMITPVYGVGIEGLWAVNTSNWRGMTHSATAFDSQYVGAYALVNLNSLFCGWRSTADRKFDVEAVAGAGWGHLYQNKTLTNAGEGEAYDATPDHNFFATKVGLNLNYYPCDLVQISVKPSVLWDMSDAGVSKTSAAYNANKATFNILAGISLKLGGSFEYEKPYDKAQVDELNDKINKLRGDIDGCNAALEDELARGRALARQLDECMKREPEVVEVVEESNDFLQTVRYVFYALGKSDIRNDQLPNVEQIAAYLKSHPQATVAIKGYASQDGPLDVNERLANQRAEAVKNALVKKYGIAADRIDASGQGIGHMFDEESWNRVAICVLENGQPVSTSTTITK